MGGIRLKRKKIIAILVIIAIVTATIMAFSLSSENEVNYKAKIVSYTINESYVEYPQIYGLKEKEKQDAINKILEAQVLKGAKNYKYETFVDLSDTDYAYTYKISVGVINEDIASFLYSFNAFATRPLEDDWKGHFSRDYGVTIDMKSGKKIELWDFMEIDERLINSDDGTNIETDYNSVTLPEFHNFKDAFMVYGSEEEEDIHHIWSIEESIANLKDKRDETNWYIDKNKNIVFYYSDNCVKIPYTQISDAIYSKYLRILDE